MESVDSRAVSVKDSMIEMKNRKIHKREDTTKKLPNRLIKDMANAEEIINAIGDGITIVDRKYRILYENKVHRNMFGYLVGEYCYKAYQSRDSVCDGCPVALTFENGEIHTVSRQLQNDKGTKYLEVTASPLKNSEGKIIAGIEVVRDITERKLLEEDIRESEEKYQSLYQEFRGILDAIPDALVLLSRDLKIVWSNEVAAKNMNMSLDDFIGQHCYTLRHGRSKPCEICPVLECYASHKPKIVESKTPDGRFWALHVYPVFDDRGEVKGVIEAAHNITERKRAEKTLKKNEKELTKRVKELEEFYNMAVGRELRMVELKKQNERLQKELEKYQNCRDFKENQ